MLSALFSISVNLFRVLIKFIKFLGDLFPIMDFTVVFMSFIISAFNYFGKKIGFVFTP